MADLSKVDEAELKSELAKRDRARQEKDRAEREETIGRVIEYRSYLQEFMHECNHDPQNPDTGYHPEHGGAFCTWCALNDLYQGQDDVQVLVDVQLCRVKP